MAAAVENRGPVRLGFLVLVLPTIAWVVQLLLGVDVGPLEPAVERWLPNVLMYGAAAACFLRAALVRPERGVALGLGLALLVWSLGDSYYRVVIWNLDEVPIPSPADLGYVLFYVPAYAAIALLLQSRYQEGDRGIWIDGAIGGLAVASVAAAVVFEAVLDGVGGAPLEIATNLTYPLADTLLLALVVGALAVSGWRLDCTWLWIGGGLIAFAVADSLYLYANAADTYVPASGSLIDAGWTVAAVMIAWAAWQPLPRAEVAATRGPRTIAVPIALALVALGVLISAAASTSLNILAVVLAGACLVAVLGRLALTHAKNLDMLETSRLEASTDALTGLGNRRKLLLDLERLIPQASARTPLLLAILDLNGFKQYNDTFGHSAGDALLLRLGSSLDDAVGHRALCYRMGGDEFCLLAELGEGERAERLVARAAAALSEAGESFSVSSASGWSLTPIEATGAVEALRVADRRMYAHKDLERDSAGRKSREVLLKALQDAHPGLSAHIDGVAAVAEATARELGMSAQDLELVRATGELHDVGKTAIPEALLDKPGPLDEVEWEFVSRHSLIAERIVAAAPALAPVAKLVRSVHERWDGSGYPDGLAGEAIPLVARVVAVCDAFHAMVSERPYRRAMSAEGALDEMHRCSGTQFDPAVVEAFAVALKRLADEAAAEAAA
jgi:diguanylate cyclase (GGDEF)-like protein